MPVSASARPSQIVQSAPETTELRVRKAKRQLCTRHALTAPGHADCAATDALHGTCQPRGRTPVKTMTHDTAQAIAAAMPPEMPAGLRHVDDTRPGHTRKKIARGFAYFDTHGKRIEDEAVIARINALVIPPAYTNVWICPDSRGHIQATGRDARGRKQYRYHPRWRETRDADKFSRMAAFGRALPRIRARVQRDLARSGIPREKVIAAVVHLLDHTLVRIGS